MDSIKIESIRTESYCKNYSIPTVIVTEDGLDGEKSNDNQNNNDNNNKLSISRSICSSTVSEEVTAEPKIAVCMQNVVFEYNEKNKFFKNFCIEIPQGKIFALLGSNGSGKTSILRLILGIMKPKSGCIKVFGVEPESNQSEIPGSGVGYMSQKIALFNELTIEETLYYYGLIYHMKSYDVQQEINDLTELLKLPERQTKIYGLNYDQQRLVSIAVTMIHRPRLLILDEPTVGVDSNLRHRIWEYLENICLNYGITVIITTYYFEEAKSASNVAFIKYGKLLTQSNPNELLVNHNCQTLEEVYLKLSQDPDLNKETPKQIFKEKEFDKKNNYYIQTKADFINLEHTRALLWKSFLRISRNPIILLLFIWLPVIQMAFFSLYIGKRPQNIAVGIYNPEIKDSISHKFIDKIDRKMINKINFDSNQSAIDSVTLGKTFYAIKFAQNFSENIETRILNPNNMTVEELESSEIKLYADMSNPVIGSYIYLSLIDSFHDFLKSLNSTFSLCFNFEQPIYGTKESSFDEFIAPGVIIQFIHMTQMFISALVLVLERKDGNLGRAFVAGVKPFEILFSHFIMLFSALLIQVPLLMAFSFLIFNIPLRGSALYAFGLILCQGLQGMSFGLLISVIASGEVFALISFYGFVFLMSFFSGMIWPLEAMPHFCQLISKLLPLTLPIDALRSVMLRGLNVTYFKVSIGYLISLLYTLIALILTRILYNRNSTLN